MQVLISQRLAIAAASRTGAGLTNGTLCPWASSQLHPDKSGENSTLRDARYLQLVAACKLRFVYASSRRSLSSVRAWRSGSRSLLPNGY